MMEYNPLALAHEVLDGSDASDDRFLDFFEARSIAHILAHAVIELTETGRGNGGLGSTGE